MKDCTVWRRIADSRLRSSKLVSEINHFFIPQSLPVAAGVAVVGATAILAKIFLFGGKGKKKSPVALIDPTVKYPLKLIDREVSFYVLILINTNVTVS